MRGGRVGVPGAVDAGVVLSDSDGDRECEVVPLVAAVATLLRREDVADAVAEEFAWLLALLARRSRRSPLW